MLQRFGRFNEELTRKYTRQLLLGLEYLHNKQ
jgi:serine/threonine protein kinase